MTDFPWFNFSYIIRKLTVPQDGMNKVFGFDSEAYETGKPFLFSTSEGDTFDPKTFLSEIYTQKYRNGNFICYNLKYETGALLYHLPKTVKQSLYDTGKADWEGLRVFFLPYKHLRFTRGKNSISFWDIYPFYRMSLNAASEKYLGKRKENMEVSHFTPKIWKDNRAEIVSYCKQDASLTVELYRKIEDRFASLGVHFKRLYSPAYVSMKYFIKHSDIVTLDEILPAHPRLVKYAAFSYRGGKFEMVQRGKGRFWEYDINAAYPFEIRNLVDIRGARVDISPEYQPKACYGFLHCKISIYDDLYHPVSMNKNGVYVYPIGEFEAYITKAEYEYLIRHGAKVEIKDACWIYPKKLSYPYRKVIDTLYRERAKHKVSDPAMYNLFKVILNSFYGKMVQRPLLRGERFFVSSGWNIIYGAIITANVRIRISEIQQKYKDSVVAVHTDSVITTKPIPGMNGSKIIGDFALTEKGNGVMILCGLYQIGDKVRTRSFRLDRNTDLIEILKKSGKADRLNFTYALPLSFKESVRRDQEELLNKFQEETKDLRLNCDNKRAWPAKVTCRDLLKGLQPSFPRPYYGK